MLLLSLDRGEDEEDEEADDDDEEDRGTESDSDGVDENEDEDMNEGASCRRLTFEDSEDALDNKAEEEDSRTVLSCFISVWSRVFRMR